MDRRTQLPVVGMVGGGQLARMTHPAAVALGQSLAVLAESEHDAAALVCADVSIGAPDDLAVLRDFASRCDVLTFDHEQVPGDLLRELVAAGVTVYPPPEALVYAQDKAAMRRRLTEFGAPMPAFEICSVGEMRSRMPDFAAAHGLPVVVKTASGGYDGHGVWMVRSVDELPPLPVETTVVLEQRAPLRRELAVMVARSPFGQAAVWPVVETVQQDGICVEVVAPAQGLDPRRAAAAGDLALRIAGEVGLVGVMAVELFEVPVGDAAPHGLMINELAMRPHNSGHWSIEGSVTSQFEQHLRAVLDYPLGATSTAAPVTVMANVLGTVDPAAIGEGSARPISIDERIHHLAARFPEVKVHWYGKSYRNGRKLGHVTVLGDDAAALRRRARLAAHWLGSGTWADGYEIHPPAGRRVVLRADGLTGAHRAGRHQTEGTR